MTHFPNADPIPLPAPVWLFKVLHDLTFALHLASVDLLLGGLILAILFALAGQRQAAGTITHRLPTVMAFVINLGIPPLLFAQVLYGRALYTSSVLIGAFWISVIVLLTWGYFGLYRAAKLADSRQSWIATGLAALLLILTISFIYSNNMTLMLRPEAWGSMYGSNPGGLQLNTSDPVLWPRWLYFVSATFPVAGAGLALLALRANIPQTTGRVFTRAGGFAIVIGIAVESVFAWIALGALPSGIMGKVQHDPLFGIFTYAWPLATALLLLAGLTMALRGSPHAAIGAIGGLAAFLNVGATVMVRDGIRDFTLRAAGFEVWNREVVTNWSVVGIFLVLFVAALAIIAYLISVIAKARPIEEKYV